MSKFRIFILILTFTCFLTWLFFDLFRTKASIELSPQLQQALEPINPTFDTETLDKIKNINNILTPTQPLPSNQPRPTPISSSRPSPSPTSPTNSIQPKTSSSITTPTTINIATNSSTLSP